MKKVIKKLKKLNEQSNNLHFIEIHSDGSGAICYETGDSFFEFYTIKQLKKYLKTLKKYLKTL